MRTLIRIGLIMGLIGAGPATLAACGGASPSSTVPSLGGAPNSAPASGGAGALSGDKTDEYRPTGAGPTGEPRRQALHAAAECIRQHGIPTYQEPVLTADGHVYTDARSIQDADRSTLTAVDTACQALIAAAQFEPESEPPAPPKLVQAGVKATECLRAHGLPNVKDPTSASRYVPGHGFGLTPDEVPSGGKTNPVVRQALEACRDLLDEAIRQSSLGSLGGA
jgi:hypothetical protein